jgi:hypothetical protein
MVRVLQRPDRTDESTTLRVRELPESRMLVVTKEEEVEEPSSGVEFSVSAGLAVDLNFLVYESKGMLEKIYFRNKLHHEL